MATQAAAGAAGAGTQPHEVLLTDVQVQSAGAGAGSGEAGGGRPGLRQRLGGQRSGCCNALLLLVAVIAVPITVALLLLWGILGLMFTIYLPTLVIAGWLGALGLYLLTGAESAAGFDAFLTANIEEYSFDTSLADVLIVHAVAAIIVMLGFAKYTHKQVTDGNDHRVWGRQCALLGIVAALCNTAFIIAKAAALKPIPGAHAHSAAKGLLVWSALVLWDEAVVMSRFWRPTSPLQLQNAERLLLKNVTTPYREHKVAGIHTLEFDGTDYGAGQGSGASGAADAAPHPNKPTLVLVHGFGAGAPMWFRNFDALSRDFHVLAIDWLGVGRSLRPRFPKLHHGARAEGFFVESMEKWRLAMGLDKFILVGHSLGGIIVAAYRDAYPEAVSHLVLASPATPSPFPEPLPLIFRIVRVLWSLNLTPQGLIRYLGPFGPPAIRFLVSARYTGANPDLNLEGVAAYTYHNWAGKGSGEYAMNGVLQPGASARIPLAQRLQPSKVTVPVTFLYGGGNDWMDETIGQSIVDTLLDAGLDADLKLVGDAGHQLFLDEPVEFCRLLTESVHYRRRRR